MNLLNRIASFFAGPRKLRNKPGGLAWIRVSGELGADLNGRVVICVGADTRGFWTVDPVQRFRVRTAAVSVTGRLIPAGAMVDLLAISDACLEPIPDAGLREEDVRRLYEPMPAELLGVKSKEKA